nr:hypothetical protein [Bacteroidota bacterium]
MKKLGLLAILYITSFFIVAQNNMNELTQKRDSVYYLYKEFKGQMTVRTWVNVVTINDYLEQIRYYDSILNYIGSENMRQNEFVIQQMQGEIKKLTDQNQVLETRVNQIGDDEDRAELIFTIPIALAAVFLIVSIVLFFAFLAKKRNAKEKEKLAKDYHKRLYNALEDVEKLNIKKNELLKEINTSQSSQQFESGTAINDLSGIAADKLMLENQMVEIKKAYDREVQKRMETEAKLDKFLPPNTEQFSHGTEMKSYVDLFKEHKQMLEELSASRSGYDREVKTRLQIEEDLRNLLEKLKQ